MMVLLVAVPSLTTAQSLHFTSKNWRVFTVTQAGKKICYMASIPTKKKGNYSKRGEPFVIVTHRAAQLDEVSVSSGYPYKDKSDVTLSIGKNKHKLFIKGERAWAKDSKTDSLLVGRMKAGSSLLVRGTSKRGTYSEDTYSLSGFTAAHGRMKKLCK